jgi:hypothetical protein
MLVELTAGAQQAAESPDVTPDAAVVLGDPDEQVAQAARLPGHDLLVLRLAKVELPPALSVP